MDAKLCANAYYEFCTKKCDSCKISELDALPVISKICDKCMITYLDFHVKFIDTYDKSNGTCTCNQALSDNSYTVHTNRFNKICNFYGNNLIVIQQYIGISIMHLSADHKIHAFNKLYEHFIKNMNNSYDVTKAKLYNYYKYSIFKYISHELQDDEQINYNYDNITKINIINGSVSDNEESDNEESNNEDSDSEESNVMKTVLGILYEIPYRDLVKFIMEYYVNEVHDITLIRIITERVKQGNFINYEELINIINGADIKNIHMENMKNLLLAIFNANSINQELYKKSLQVSYRTIGEDFIKEYLQEYKDNIAEATEELIQITAEKIRQMSCVIAKQ